MLLTTTGFIEGKRILEYKGIVFGEVISGVNYFKDIGAGFRNLVGGRVQGYEDELVKAREDALMEMQSRAFQNGANAIVGVTVDYETLGSGGMLMVTASGTAVLTD